MRDNYCTVPTDYHGDPLITKEMKAAIMGEFSIVVYMPSEDGMQMIPQHEIIRGIHAKRFIKLWLI